MNILALETATDACSVALLTANGVCEEHVVAPRRHTELLFAMIDRVLAQAGINRRALDLIAFGRGPGAFTGVRIAAAAAQGIAAAHDLPLAPVSTLAALAVGGARCFGAARIVAAIDARRGEIYAGGWRFEGSDPIGTCLFADTLQAPAALVLPDAAAWLAVGNAWSTYAMAFSPALAAITRADLPYPHARDVARIGADMHARGTTVAVADALPIYLRGALD